MALITLRNVPYSGTWAWIIGTQQWGSNENLLSIQSSSNRQNTFEFADNRSTNGFIHWSNRTREITSPRLRYYAQYSCHTRKERSEDGRVSSQNKRTTTKVHSTGGFAHPSISFGNTNYDYRLKQRFNLLSVVVDKSFNLMHVCNIPVQDRNTKIRFQSFNTARMGNQ